jgi:hypothetical protein
MYMSTKYNIYFLMSRQILVLHDYTRGSEKDLT